MLRAICAGRIFQGGRSEIVTRWERDEFGNPVEEKRWLLDGNLVGYERFPFVPRKPIAKNQKQADAA